MQLIVMPNSRPRPQWNQYLGQKNFYSHYFAGQHLRRQHRSHSARP